MTIHSYKEHTPSISEGVFIAPSADVVGRVTLAAHVSVWFQTVVRADVNSISIGEETNIQDHSCLHVTSQNALVIGKGVTIGHSVTLHACTIGDHALIGMGATVLDGAVIGKNSLVAAGSLVTPGKVFPANSLIQGSPAKCIRKLTAVELKTYGEHYKSYVALKADYLQSQI